MKPNAYHPALICACPGWLPGNMNQVTTMAKIKPNTRAQGAADERQTWIAKLKRELKNAGLKTGEVQLLDRLLAWGTKRCLRYNKKPGGLGKTKKATAK